MATRTGAPYTHFEGTYCVEEIGGCGQLLRSDEHDPWPLEPDDLSCPNCGAGPLAHVSVTTADQIPDTFYAEDVDDEPVQVAPGAQGSGTES